MPKRKINFKTNIFSCTVYEAIGKYINPTRYHQILETESIEKLAASEQANLSQDQKHASAVAKIHYPKRKSEDIAAKAKETINKLRDKIESSSVINLIKSDTEISASNNALLCSNDSEKAGTFSVNSIRMKRVLFSEMEDSFLKQGIFRIWYGKMD